MSMQSTHECDGNLDLNSLIGCGLGRTLLLGLLSLFSKEDRDGASARLRFTVQYAVRYDNIILVVAIEVGDGEAGPAG